MNRSNHDKKDHAGDPTHPGMDALTITAQFEPLLAANNLDSLDGLFAIPRSGELDKPGLAPWRERLRIEVDHEGSTQTLYLKRFDRPPADVQRWVGRSGTSARSIAGVEWAWLNSLTGDGIPCPQPVAFGEELDGQRELRSAVLMAAVPGRSLENWTKIWDKEDRKTIQGLLSPLADLIARLHALGYFHRDLYLSHIFFDPELPADRSLHIIDVQRVEHPAMFRSHGIVKDLASLNYSSSASCISLSDRLRWLKRYLGLARLDPEGRRLVYRVIGKTEQIAQHDRRRTAKLAAQGERR